MTADGSNNWDKEPEGDWDSDEALAALNMERDMRPEESFEQTTRRLIEESAPMAAQKIVHIAMHADNDNTALAASRYIVDMATSAETENGKAAWEKFMADVVSDAELHANAEHS